MARLRFPGRPGCRADRVGIPYCADDVSESTDPVLQLITSLKRGIHEFKELCGESEGEEFEGFTNEDVRLSGKKLRAAIRTEHRLQGFHPTASRVSETDHQPSPQSSHHRSSAAHTSPSPHPKSQSVQGIFGPVSTPGEFPPLSRDEILRKALAAKELLASLKAKHKHALQGRVVQNKVGRPRKPWKPAGKGGGKIPPATPPPAPSTTKSRGLKSKLVSKKAERKSATYQTPKIRLSSKHQVQKSAKIRLPDVKVSLQDVKKKVGPKTESPPVRLPKDRSKTVVRQLLQKAKHGASRPVAKLQGADHGSGEVAAQKRNVHTFVLPQFSRSRRAIIPNKRFIEDDPIPSAVLIKRPRTEAASQLDPDTQPSESADDDKEIMPSPSSSILHSKKNGKLKTSMQSTVTKKKVLKSSIGCSSTPSTISNPSNNPKRSQKSTPVEESESSSQSAGLKAGKKLKAAKSTLGISPVSTGKKTGKCSSKDESNPLSFKVEPGATPRDSTKMETSVVSCSKAEMAPKIKTTTRTDGTSKSARTNVISRASRTDMTRRASVTDVTSKSNKAYVIAAARVSGNGTEASPQADRMEGAQTSRTCSSSTAMIDAEEQKNTEHVPSAEQLLQLDMSPVVAVTPHKMDPSQTPPSTSDLLLTASASSFRKGLLEQPLIIEGKRQRVPSLKVRMINRQSEESAAASESESSDLAAGEEFRQNGSKQEKFALFPKAPASAPKKFSRAGPMKLQRRDKDGKESFLMKRSGQIMLRKAKLQLNRTALNRSKAALARSLKAQLKREAKQKASRSESQRHSPRPGVTSPLSISVLGPGSAHPFDSPNSQPSPLLAGLSPGSQGGFASPPRIVSSLSPISLPSKKEPGETTVDKSRESTKPVSRGPRIKHVCRRAAVVLPKPLATFPAPPDPSESPTLSALPSPEKEKLLQSHTAHSDDDKDSSEEEKRKYKRKKQIIPGAKLKTLQAKFGRFRGRRKNRCKECRGCLAPNCGKCVYCFNRKCERPVYSKQATDAFIQPKNNNNKGGGGGGGGGKEADEVDSHQVRQGPSRMARPAAGFFASMGGDSRGEEAQDEGEGGPGERSPSPTPSRERAVRPAHPSSRMEVERGVVDEGGLEIMSAVGVQRHTLTHHARRLLKRKEKTGLRVRLPLAVPEPQPMVVTSTLWSLPPNTRSILHTDLKKSGCVICCGQENFEVDMAWCRGLALTMAGPTCVRAVCFLCGSAGREKLLYCSICCEPFHWFCLEEEDRPLEGRSVDNWCCRRCQFCHVCGLQTGLLQCDRCQDTYHPECLGPAYPKQPSRRNMWVCTKCVRCKSCGATTPGSGTSATWTYDFSLCFDCGKLMDKGNFCPICRKCYTDDDWESKMVQCGLCDSWVHARCEGLTDEMYQLFSFLPEDIQYRCRVCCPDDPPEWRTILRDELLTGLRSVLTGLTSFKCSHHLVVIDEEKERERSFKALQRKKPVPALASPETLRTSPRLPRHTRSSHASPSEKHAPETDAEKGEPSPKPASSPACSIKGGGVSTNSSFSDVSPEKEEPLEAVEVSDGEVVSPVKSDGPTKRSTQCSSDWGCEGENPVKASGVSEKGIGERLADSKPGDSRQPHGRLDDSLEIKPDVDFDSEGKIPFENRPGRETDTKPSPEVKDGNDEGKEATLGGARSPILSSLSTSLTSEPLSVAMGTTGSDTLITSAAMDPGNGVTYGVARNLFDTFLASADAKGFQDGHRSRPTDRTDGKGEKSSDQEEEKDIKTDIQNQDTTTSPSQLARTETSDHHNTAQTASQSGSLLPGTESSPCSSNTSRSTPCSKNSETEHACGAGEGSGCVKKAKEEQTDFLTAGETDLPSSAQTLSCPGETVESSGDAGSMVRSARPHVTYTVNMVTEATNPQPLLPQFQRQFPRDFSAVRLKLEGDKYDSVEEFNEDMVHIIQTALSSDHLFPRHRKNNNSVKSIFIKQMERVFPWFNVKTCQLWQHNCALPQGMLPDAVVPPYNDHTYAQWLERESSLSVPQLSLFKPLVASLCDSALAVEVSDLYEDMRQCALCLEMGDAYPDDAGRLLYAGQDDWVHVNCALWSAEVFEEEDGTLQNVHVAMVRGRQLRCNRCQMQGATVGCCVQGCPANYHFLCARRQLCLFKEDKTVYCYEHSQQASSQIENHRGFAVQRRMCVDMADIRCMKKSWARGLDAANVSVLFGCCTVEHLGSLAPLSDCKGCLLPLEFRCSRVYWSTVDAKRRTVYTCRIIEVRPVPATPEPLLRDVRVIHDELHPDYVPLDSLDLPSMGLAHLMPPGDDVVCIGQTSPNNIEPYEQCARSSEEEPGSVECGDKTATVADNKESFDSTASSACSLAVVDSSSSCTTTSTLSAFSEPSQRVGRPPAPAAARPAVDYSRLSASTLKLLNIADPSNVASLTRTHPSLPPASNAPLEFGNLTCMVERLNSAALRSKSGRETGSEGAGLHSRRWSSADQVCDTDYDTVAARQRRSMSLSPVGFATKPSVCFPSVVRRLGRCRSLSPSDMRRSCVLPLRKSPTVMPILEQLEHELADSDREGKSPRLPRTRGRRGSSLPPGAEVFVDLTVDDGDDDPSAGAASDETAKSSKETVDTNFTEVGMAGGESSGNDTPQGEGVGKEMVGDKTHAEDEGEVNSDVVLAERVLQSVPKEILESSEVKVLVVPDNVSEEEALQLAEEALRHSDQPEHDQTAPVSGELTCEGTVVSEDSNLSHAMEEATDAKNRTKVNDEQNCPTEKCDNAAANDGDVLKGDQRSQCASSDVDCVATEDQLVGKPCQGDQGGSLENCETPSQPQRKVGVQENPAPESPRTLTQRETSQWRLERKDPTHCAPLMPDTVGQTVDSAKEVQKHSLDQSSTGGDQSQGAMGSMNQGQGHVLGAGPPQETCMTASLKLAETLKFAYVYDKKGNLIGQRRHRPYVVETVQKKGDLLNIGIQRAFERGISGLGNKAPFEHFRLSLNTSVTGKTLASTEDNKQEDTTLTQSHPESMTQVSGRSLVRHEAGLGDSGSAVTSAAQSTEGGGEKEPGHVTHRLVDDPVALDCSKTSWSTENVLLGKDAATEGVGKSVRTAEPSCTALNNSGSISTKLPACERMRGPASGVISPRIKLPEDFDARRLQCAVSVPKLCLNDMNSSISVKDVCEYHGINKCSVTDCPQREGVPPPAGTGLSTETDCVKDENSAISEAECGTEASTTTATDSCAMNLESQPESVEQKAGPSVDSVSVEDLQQNLMEANTSSQLLRKLGLDCAASPESSCLESLMSASGKRLCNGADKEGCSPPDPLRCQQDLMDMALHPPPSVSQPIPQALRTVECRVSLERLSSGGSRSRDVAAGNASPPHDPDHSNGSFPIGAQPPSSAERSKAASSTQQSLAHDDMGVGSEGVCVSHAVSSSSTLHALKVGESCPSLNHRLVAFPGKLESEGQNAASGEATKVENARQHRAGQTQDTSRNIAVENDVDQPAPDSSGENDVQSWNGPVDLDRSPQSSTVDSDSLPLHTELALRIKAESLARSSPGESGPFKCPTCKRLYRTVLSFSAHAQSCDFDVSTSDEEEEGDEDRKEGQREREGKGEGGKQSLRTSLRQSTLTQRKAMESSQQQLAQQAAEKTVSSNMSKNCKQPVVSDKPLSSALAKSALPHGDASPPRTRGRPRKLSGSEFRESHPSQHIPEPGRRGRGRPRKVSGQASEPDSQDVVEKLTEQLSPKESLLGAVGLVSKNCLEMQAAMASARSPTTPSPTSERRGPRPPAHSPSMQHYGSLQDMFSWEKQEKTGQDSPIDPTVCGSPASPQRAVHSAEESLASSVPASTPHSDASASKPGGGQTEADKNSSTTNTVGELQQVLEKSSMDVAGSASQSVGVPTSCGLGSQGEQDKLEDSDHDSDVIIIDDDPIRTVGTSAVPDKPASQQNHPSVPVETAKPVPMVSSKGRAQGEMSGRNLRTGTESRHVPVADSVSKPQADMPVRREAVPLHVNVTHQSDIRMLPSVVTNRAETSPLMVHVAQHTPSIPTSSALASSLSFSGAATITTSAFSSQSYSSGSSLLLSSSNVQADIDSDDLSFTDSEDEENGMEVAPPPPPTTHSSSRGGMTLLTSSMGTTVSTNSPCASILPSGPNSAASSLTLTGTTTVTMSRVTTAPLSSCPTFVTMSRVTSTPLSSPLSVSVPTTVSSTGTGATQASSSQHTSATQLLSVLDKLSAEQKLILTQQLFKKGTLSIENHAMPQPPLNLTQGATGPSSSNLMMGDGSQVIGDGGQSGYSVGTIQASLIPGTSTLRIMNPPSAMSAGQLAFVPQQQDGVIMGATPVAPALMTQQAAPSSVQILQHRPGIVVQHPVLPVAPVTSLSPFATSPAGMASPLLSSLPVSTPSSLSTGLLPVQGQAPPTILPAQAQAAQGVLPAHAQAQSAVLCPPAAVMNTLTPQTLMAGPVPAMGYMGSFLVQPSKTNASSADEKARLQLLSLIQGAVSSSQAVSAHNTIPTVPTLLSSMAGGLNVTQGMGTAQAGRGSSTAPPRVIRLVVDKPLHGEHPLTTMSSPSLVRIMQVTPAVPPTPPPGISHSSLSLSSAAPQSLSMSSTHAVLPSVHDNSRNVLIGGASQPVSRPSAVFIRKRPAYALQASPPLSKRSKMVSLERNGLVQVKDSLQLLSESDGVTSVSRAVEPAPSGGAMGAASATASCQTQYRVGAPLNHESANGTVSKFKALLKNKITNRARKQILAVVKDSKAVRHSGVSGPPTKGKARAKVKAKGEVTPIKKKGMRRKGGPLSHPIVHLSHQAGAILPQAEVEEEIRDTPLRQNPTLPPSQRPREGHGAWPKDMPRLAFEISSEDGFSCRADTMEDAWRQVTDKVQDARAAARMKQLSYGGVNGVQMFGVGHDTVVYLVEQLAGAANCRQYKFRYHHYEPPEEEELLVNPSGSARCSPFASRKPYDIFSFLMSRHRHRPCQDNSKSKEEEMEHKSSRRATSMELPMAMRFRKLQEHAKEAVGVYRSKIHGRGLFCKRNIDNGEMVIEYSGEIIRSSLTDKREKYYESKGIGCYMFRIDDFEVVDATMHGSAARFINHSCEPNCYSKVISVDGKKHIVIFASRAIKKGEELTYDYKFPIEDVKIPCTCGSRRCRKYLN